MPTRAHGRTRPPERPSGSEGEEIAARYLAERGYQILARNLRSRLGEVDLIARDGATLVLVEVKTRLGVPREPRRAESGAERGQRLARLALDVLAREWLRDLACRFDVVTVTFDPAGGPPRVDHFPGVFAADTGPK
jgi:putative endonuclease